MTIQGPTQAPNVPARLLAEHRFSSAVVGTTCLTISGAPCALAVTADGVLYASRLPARAGHAQSGAVPTLLSWRSAEADALRSRDIDIVPEFVDLRAEHDPWAPSITLRLLVRLWRGPFAAGFRVQRFSLHLEPARQELALSSMAYGGSNYYEHLREGSPRVPAWVSRHVSLHGERGDPYTRDGLAYSEDFRFAAFVGGQWQYADAAGRPLTCDVKGRPMASKLNLAPCRPPTAVTWHPSTGWLRVDENGTLHDSQGGRYAVRVPAAARAVSVLQKTDVDSVPPAPPEELVVGYGSGHLRYFALTPEAESEHVRTLLLTALDLRTEKAPINEIEKLHRDDQLELGRRLLGAQANDATLRDRVRELLVHSVFGSVRLELGEAIGTWLMASEAGPIRDARAEWVLELYESAELLLRQGIDLPVLASETGSNEGAMLSRLRERARRTRWDLVESPPGHFDAREEAEAWADFALYDLLPEASAPLGSDVIAVSPLTWETAPWAVVVRTDGVTLEPLPTRGGPKPRPQVWPRPSFDGPAVISAVWSSLVGGGPASLIGTAHGELAFVCEQGAETYAVPAESCVGISTVRCTDHETEVRVLWSAGGASRAEHLMLTREPRLALRRARSEPLVLPAVAALATPRSGALHAHASALTTELLVKGDGREMGFQTATPARCLAWLDEGTLIAGCDDGLIWAFEVAERRVAWVYALRAPVSCVSVSPDGRWVLAQSRAGDIVRLDTTGKRLARSRLGARVMALGFVPESGNPIRAVYVDDRGVALTYRDAPQLRSRAEQEVKRRVKEDEPRPRSEHVAVVAAVAGTEQQVFAKLHDRDARAWLLERWAERGISEDLLARLPRVFTARDLVTLARALPDRQLPGFVRALPARAQRDAGAGRIPVSYAFAAAELLRRSGPVYLWHLTDWLRELSGLPAHPWARLEAARAWERALAASAGRPHDRIVELCRLDTEQATYLPLLLAQGSNGRAGTADLECTSVLVACARDPESKPLWLAAAAALEARQEPVARALCAALRAGATNPTFDELVRGADLSRKVKLRGGGPLAEIARCLGTTLRPPPDTDTPLPEQTAWVTRELSRGRRDHRPAGPWDQFRAAVAEAIAESVRARLVERLAILQGRVRARFVNRRVHWLDRARLELHGDLVGEGAASLNDVQLEIGVLDSIDRSLGATVVGEPENRLRVHQLDTDTLEGIVISIQDVPSGLGALAVAVRVFQGAAELDRACVSVKLPERPGGARGGGLRLAALPQRWKDAAVGLRAAKGLVLVASTAQCDDQALRGMWGGPVVSMDAHFRDRGPGRRYPLEFGGRYLAEWLEASRSTEHDSIFVCDGEETWDRILAAGEEMAPFFALLRRLVGQSTVTLLTAPLPVAHRVFRRLPGARLSNPAGASVRTSATLETELLEAVKGHAGDPREARELVAQSAGDLVALDALLARRSLDLYLREELSRVSPHAALAFVGLIGARSRLIWKHIRPTHIADEDVKTVVRAAHNQPKSVIRAGEPVGSQTAAGPELSHTDGLWVRGWVEQANTIAPNKAYFAFVTPETLAELEHAGLASAATGAWLPARPHAGFVESLLASPPRDREAGGERLRRALFDPSSFWTDVPLSVLAGLSVEAAELVFGRRSEALRQAARAFAQGWSALAAGRVEPAAFAPLLRFLTGSRVESLDSGADHHRFRLGERSTSAIAVVATLGASVDDQADVEVIWLSPGAPPPLRAARSVVYLGEPDLRTLISSDDPQATYYSLLRVRRGLRSVSPFQHSGPLAPDSVAFVGRRGLIDDLVEIAPRRDVLIVGPRQIGKTSVLNRLERRLTERGGLGVLRLEGMGKRVSTDFAAELEQGWAQLCPGALPSPGASPTELVESLAVELQRSARTLVVLINEIDGLVQADLPYLGRLRGLSERGLLRCIYVGYVRAVQALRDPNVPFFHQTSGDLGRRLIELGEFPAAEADELIDLLEKPPLGLRWRASERDAGRRLLREHSFGVPWMLQQACELLLEHLEGRGSGELRLDDVRSVVERSSPVAEYLKTLDLGAIATPREDAAQTEKTDAIRALAKAIPLVLVLHLYPEADAVDTQRLSREDSRFRGFTIAGAESDVVRWLHDNAPITDGEQRRLRHLVAAFPWTAFIDGLSLTLILTEHPEGAPRERADAAGQRWFSFRRHLYPVEVLRHGMDSAVQMIYECVERSLALERV